MTAGNTTLQIPHFEIETYRVRETDRIMTPALAIYTDLVDENLRFTLELLGGDTSRWRPHVKTAKLGYTMRRFIEAGIHRFKCSTTLEAITVCDAGAEDVLIAYPLVAAAVVRVRQVADRFPRARLSALVETAGQVEGWSGSRVGLFVDVNPGMDRTGVEQDRVDAITDLARRILDTGLEFRGLHYYDGHLSKYALEDRESHAHTGYNQLMEIVAAFVKRGVPVEEVITAGTPAFPCSLTYEGFGRAPFSHRVSPGTVIYCDCTSLSQLPPDWRYRPAALVLSRIVSNPAPNRVTCDAGHKTVSADAGLPTCAVLGKRGLVPGRPSEEHLPIKTADSEAPSIGEILYLVPRHICPTVNNFDHALMIRNGEVVGVERVTARGREHPLLSRVEPD